MIVDYLANGIMLAADAAFLYGLWKRRRLPAFWANLGIAAVLCLIFAAVLGRGMFGAMRVLAWAIFVHAVIVLAGSAALLWMQHRKTAIGSLIAGSLIALVGVDAFFIEPHRLEVTTVRISSPKVSRRFRIAVVADIQADSIGDYEREAMVRVKAADPDLILFAGDYIQEMDPARRKKLMSELKSALRGAGLTGLQAAMAVQGNCDEDDWQEIFEKTGIAWTKETRSAEEGDLKLTGLSEADSFNPSLSIPPADRFHIVVGHAPDFALGNVQADLLVAGHTHGGQVRLPLIGPLVTLSKVPRSWAAGVTQLSGGRTLVVSRGIGMERSVAPRLRFLCRPEIVIIDLRPAPRQK
jgi:predicted MPP superfamily phosphohydrolase